MKDDMPITSHEDTTVTEEIYLSDAAAEPALALPDPITISLPDFLRPFRFGDNPIVSFRILPPKLKNEPKPTKEDLAKFSKAKVPFFAWRQSITEPYGIETRPYTEDVALALVGDVKKGPIRKIIRTNAGQDARAVYFVVNQGGQKKEQIDRFTAFFLEYDDIPILEQYARVKALPIEPHILVKTKASLHCYWLADESTTGEEWDAVQRTFIVYANSDPAIKDRPRVMRVPGFDHTTFDFQTGQVTRVAVELLKFETETRVTAADVLAMLKAQGQEEVTASGFHHWLQLRNQNNKERAKVRAERERRGASLAKIYGDGEVPASLRTRYNDICNRVQIVHEIEADCVRAFCPCCEDPSPSLILTLTADKILMMCQAMCTFREVCDSLGVEQKHTFAPKKEKALPPAKAAAAWRVKKSEAVPEEPEGWYHEGPIEEIAPEALADYADEIYTSDPPPAGDDPPEDDRPRIYAGTQDPVDLAEEVWPLLMMQEKRRRTLFNFNAVLSRVEHAEEKKRKIETPDGNVQVRPINQEMLRHRLNRIAVWWKIQNKQEVECPAPTYLVQDMLSAPLCDTPVPVLRRITAEPVYDREGNLVNRPGFDVKSGIYYTPRFAPLPVAAYPSKEEMIAARDFLLDLISDFPFEDQASRDNALAFGLVPHAREMIQGPVPMSFVTAAVPRTGKTKLIKVLVGKQNYNMMVYSEDDSEMRKKITSAIMSGLASTLIDNVNETLDSASLAAVLTGDVWSDRVLGSNQVCQALPTVQWIASANNPTTSREISGRSVVTRLIATTDRPEERDDFKIADIEIHAEKERPRIVQAYLTMIGYWIGQGCPAPTGIKLGGFEEYVRVIGGILQACELTHLANYKKASDELDTERTAVARICNAWWGKYSTPDCQRTLAKKAGDIWSLCSEVDGLPQKVNSSQAFGYYLKGLHERRVTYVGPPKEVEEGKTPEDYPTIERQFVIRLCKYTRHNSNLYDLEMTSEMMLSPARSGGDGAFPGAISKQAQQAVSKNGHLNGAQGGTVGLLASEILKTDDEGFFPQEEDDGSVNPHF